MTPVLHPTSNPSANPDNSTFKIHPESDHFTIATTTMGKSIILISLPSTFGPLQSILNRTSWLILLNLGEKRGEKNQKTLGKSCHCPAQSPEMLSISVALWALGEHPQPFLPWPYLLPTTRLTHAALDTLAVLPCFPPILTLPKLFPPPEMFCQIP